MKKEKCLLLLLILIISVLISANISFASTYADWGTNITIYDGRADTTHRSNWYEGQNNGNEDQEVEPGNAIGQSWDLEGFFLKGSYLTMVGGYNFVDGQPMWTGSGSDGEPYTVDDTYIQIHSGDIFIDVDGSYTQTLTGNYGYEYVLDMDFSTNGTTYTVYDLRTGTIALENVITGLGNDFSNPWRYSSGGSEVGATGQSASYETLLTDGKSGFSGGWHNAVMVNLDFLSSYELANFTAHFTMECGNDNLMGSAPVPEPSTILLFGIGLLGLTSISRRKKP